MPTKTIAETLRIKPHSTVWSTQPEYLDLIGVLPDGVTTADSMDQATTAILFAASEAAARETLDKLKDRLDAPKVLWVAFPLGDAADIDRDTLGAILAEHRRRPVSRQVEIDDTWAAMRFGNMKPGEQAPGSAPDRAADDTPSDLPAGLSAPSRRALAGAGIRTLAELSRYTESEVLALHGLGPKSIQPLRDALAARGLSFARNR